MPALPSFAFVLHPAMASTVAATRTTPPWSSELRTPSTFSAAGYPSVRGCESHLSGPTPSPAQARLMGGEDPKAAPDAGAASTRKRRAALPSHRAPPPPSAAACLVAPCSSPLPPAGPFRFAAGGWDGAAGPGTGPVDALLPPLFCLLSRPPPAFAGYLGPGLPPGPGWPATPWDAPAGRFLPLPFAWAERSAAEALAATEGARSAPV